MTKDETKPRVYEVGNVVIEHRKNDAGGIDVVDGILYRFVDDNREAGVLAHSVGPEGESTGIFRDMKGTYSGEVVEIVDAPEGADMEISQEYKENDKAYNEAMEEMYEKQNEQSGEAGQRMR